MKIPSELSRVIIYMKLVYLKDSNAAGHSVDNDIFYVVIDLSARSKSYIITFISLIKSCQVLLRNLKSVLVCINFMYHDESMARREKGSRQ